MPSFPLFAFVATMSCRGFPPSVTAGEQGNEGLDGQIDSLADQRTWSRPSRPAVPCRSPWCMGDRRGPAASGLQGSTPPCVTRPTALHCTRGASRRGNIAMPRIFVSYRREDSESVAGRLHDRLEAHFGRDNVFFDIATIPFGVDFREHLERAVAQCDILLAVIGEAWLEARYRDGPRQGQRRLDDEADFVRIEVESALARDIPVIPVLVGKATMPGERDLPEGLLRGLAFRNAAEVRSGRDFNNHVGRLIRGIEQLVEEDQQWRETRREDEDIESAVSPPPKPRRTPPKWLKWLLIVEGVLVSLVLITFGINSGMQHGWLQGIASTVCAAVLMGLLVLFVIVGSRQKRKE
jgi:hypothetical protein